MLERLGFVEVRLDRRFDPFRGTSKEAVARKFAVEGANIFARKPAGTGR